VLAAWGGVGGWLVAEAWSRTGAGLWEDIARRAIDFYAAATVLLALIVLVRSRFQQAWKRLAVITAGLAGLLVLGVATLLPGLPRYPLPWEELLSRFGARSDAVGDRTVADAMADHGGSGLPNFQARFGRELPLEPPPAGAVVDSAVDGGRSREPFRLKAAGFDTRGFLEWFGKLYVGGAVLAVVWLAQGAARVAGVVARSQPAPNWIRLALRAVAGGAATRVRTLVTDECASAAAVGGFRPAILLPACQLADAHTAPPSAGPATARPAAASQAAASQPAASQPAASQPVASQPAASQPAASQPAASQPAAAVRAVLGHEWSHIRRGDLRRMALARVLWVPLYAHPLYWWLRSSQRLDQELLADRAAIAASGLESTEYAGMLLQWAQAPFTRSDWAAEMLGIGRRSSHLSRRIAMLLGEKTMCADEPTSGRRWTYAGVLAAVVAAAALSLTTISPAPVVWAAGEHTSQLASEQPSARPDHRPNGQSDGQSDPRPNTRSDGQSNGQSDGQSNGQANARPGEQTGTRPGSPAKIVAGQATGSAMDEGRPAAARSRDNSDDCKPDQELPGEARRKAVSLALEWLVRHQDADGGWRFAHGASCPMKQADGQGACSGGGNATADTASTGMALLALMANGHRPGVEGPYRSAVDAGVEWLVQQQTADGRLYAQNGLSGTLYSQGIATLALCEAFHGGRGGGRADRLKLPAQRGLDFIVRAQDKNGGGWRYQPGMPGDTSVLGWQILALRSGQQAGLAVEQATLDGAAKFLKSVAGGPNNEFYSYTPNGNVGNKSSTLTAVGALSRQLLGAQPDDKAVVKGVELLATDKPELGANRDSYRWFFSSQAIDRSPDAAARVAWQADLAAILVRSQERVGCAAGSWDAANPQPDKWSQIGGRLMATALSTIALSVEDRRLAILIASRTVLD
jgi:hypothetical protein